MEFISMNKDIEVLCFSYDEETHTIDRIIKLLQLSLEVEVSLLQTP